MNEAHEVVRPGLLTCCRALAGLPVGLAHPRRPDERLLASLTDRGLPDSSTTVEIITLPQQPRMVPTAGIAEGVWRPIRTANLINAFVVRHPEATFLVDPGVCVTSSTSGAHWSSPRSTRRRSTSRCPPICTGIMSRDCSIFPAYRCT